MTDNIPCAGTNREGEPCRQTTTVRVDPDGVARCDFHTIDERRRAAHIARFHERGGRVSGRKEDAPPIPTTAAEVREFVAWTMRAVARGQLTAPVGSTIERLAQMWFAADGIALKMAAREARDGVA